MTYEDDLRYQLTSNSKISQTSSIVCMVQLAAFILGCYWNSVIIEKLLELFSVLGNTTGEEI